MKILLLIGMLLTLAACHKHNADYYYLMLHEPELRQEYASCTSDFYTISPSCKVIMRAQADFADLVSERAANAEEFGMKIIQAQMHNAQLYHATTTKSLQQHAPLSISLLASTKEFTAYHLSSEQVNILLAVVSATSLI